MFDETKNKMHINTIYRLFNYIKHNIQYIRCKEFQYTPIGVQKNQNNIIQLHSNWSEPIR